MGKDKEDQSKGVLFEQQGQKSQKSKLTKKKKQDHWMIDYAIHVCRGNRPTQITLPALLPTTK
jgi:hypothetical protein